MVATATGNLFPLWRSILEFLTWEELDQVTSSSGNHESSDGYPKTWQSIGNDLWEYYEEKLLSIPLAIRSQCPTPKQRLLRFQAASKISREAVARHRSRLHRRRYFLGCPGCRTRLVEDDNLRRSNIEYEYFLALYYKPANDEESQLVFQGFCRAMTKSGLSIGAWAQQAADGIDVNEASSNHSLGNTRAEYSSPTSRWKDWDDLRYYVQGHSDAEDETESTEASPDSVRPDWKHSTKYIQTRYYAVVTRMPLLFVSDNRQDELKSMQVVMVASPANRHLQFHVLDEAALERLDDHALLESNTPPSSSNSDREEETSNNEGSHSACLHVWIRKRSDGQAAFSDIQFDSCFFDPELDPA